MSRAGVVRVAGSGALLAMLCLAGRPVWAQDLRVGYTVAHSAVDPVQQEEFRQELESYVRRELRALDSVSAEPLAETITPDVRIDFVTISIGGEPGRPFLGYVATVGVFQRCAADLGRGSGTLADELMGVFAPAVGAGSVSSDLAMTAVIAVGQLCYVEKRRTLHLWPAQSDVATLVRSQIATIDTAVLEPARSVRR